jgi:proline dehydrogenase
MCLAEALLRIPDKATRDALIRDKISNGNWQSHIGRSPSLFVNAATWGLLFTGKLVSTHNEASLSRSEPHHRQERRTADPQRRGHGDAPDGRAVRHRRNHRRSAGQRPQAGR